MYIVDTMSHDLFQIQFRERIHTVRNMFHIASKHRQSADSRIVAQIYKFFDVLRYKNALQLHTTQLWTHLFIDYQVTERNSWSIASTETIDFSRQPYGSVSYRITAS